MVEVELLVQDEDVDVSLAVERTGARAVHKDHRAVHDEQRLAVLERNARAAAVLADDLSHAAASNDVLDAAHDRQLFLGDERQAQLARAHGGVQLHYLALGHEKVERLVGVAVLEQRRGVPGPAPRLRAR